VDRHLRVPLEIGSFASGQAAAVEAGAIVGSYARGQAATDATESHRREGSFAAGQACTDPQLWATGRFCTGQERGDQRRTGPAVPIDTTRTAEASAAD
jgi:hypothetical protein